MDKLEELIQLIDTKSQWNKDDLKNKLIQTQQSILNKLSNDGKLEIIGKSSKMTNVKYVKKYDVLYMPIFGIAHYFLVHQVKNKLVYGVLLSSKDKSHSIHKITIDRYFKDNYATSTYVFVDELDALKCFVRAFENKKEADMIFIKVKNHYKKVLNLR
jgi:hypothetical protein